MCCARPASSCKRCRAGSPRSWRARRRGCATARSTRSSPRATCPHQIAEQLSPSHPVEFLADRSIRFQCRCSPERIRASLQLLTRRDLDEMIADDEPASVTCNFCNTTHSVPVEELREIRDALVALVAPVKN